MDRAAQKDFRLYVDVDASQITGHTVAWFDYFGKYTFTADRDKPEAAVPHIGTRRRAPSRRRRGA